MIDTVLCWIGQFLNWLDKITGSYMLALLLFALIVEVLMLPFGIKQQKNQIKQAQLRPKEMAIRNKYKGRNDKVTQQKVTEEIQTMYQQENYNQFSGCLPLLIQMPIILALYQVVINPLQYVIGISKEAITAMQTFISAAVEDGGLGETIGRGTIELISSINKLGMEHYSGVAEYVTNHASDLNISLSGADVLNEFTSAANAGFPDFTIFGGGLDLGAIPSIKEPGWLWLIPVLTFLAYFGSMKLNRRFSYQPTTSGDAATDKATGCSNAMMDVMMPLFSVYITFLVPAAVGVYWIFKSILGTVKQFAMSKLMPMPQFTEEDYKAAEREYAGKSANSRSSKLDIDATKENPKSLFHQDDEDYVSPEKEAEIMKKLDSADPDKKVPESEGVIAKAALKDESDKNK